MVGTEQRAQNILFSVVFTPSSPSHHGSVWVLYLSSLYFNKHCIAGAGLPNHMMGEVSLDLKKDDCGPISIQFSLNPNTESSRSETLLMLSQRGVRLSLYWFNKEWGVRLSFMEPTRRMILLMFKSTQSETLLILSQQLK